MKRCVVGISRGGDAEVAGSGKYAPTVWFPSMAAVLSEDNRTLLCVIRDAKPKTLTELTELAALSGRQVPNLSRTLRMMEGYGLVELKRNAREIEPIARATDFLVVLDSPQGEQE